MPSSWTILEACRSLGIDTPTLCYLENLTPVNVCRVCVVEVAGSRTLVPACSRRVEPGMEIRTDSPRVRLSRKMVLEFLGSSVDLSTAPQAREYAARYGARPERYGPPMPPSPAGGARCPRAGPSSSARRGPPRRPSPSRSRSITTCTSATTAKCILCYKCVEACGTDAQNTFAIAVAGRGFDARISTEGDVPLPDSACVYCGNCIGVCPTGALMFRSEYEMRQAGTWDESRQTKTDTICPYCGVGCTLSLHVQDNRIVKVTSPMDVEVTHGHLCIKGRFGFEFVHGGDLEAERPQANGLEL